MPTRRRRGPTLRQIIDAERVAFPVPCPKCGAAVNKECTDRRKAGFNIEITGRPLPHDERIRAGEEAAQAARQET